LQTVCTIAGKAAAGLLRDYDKRMERSTAILTATAARKIA